MDIVEERSHPWTNSTGTATGSSPPRRPFWLDEEEDDEDLSWREHRPDAKGYTLGGGDFHEDLYLPEEDLNASIESILAGETEI